MPFVKDFTDQNTGAHFPESFWCPMRFRVDYLNRTLGVTFVCFVSAEDQASGKAPLPYERAYQLAGEGFAAFVNSPAAAGSASDPLALSIARALDQVGLLVQDESDGQGGLVSFFSGATHVDPALGVLQQ